MSMTDPIADMLTRIRNASRRLLTDVTMPSSRLKMAIATVLKEEGYIADCELIAGDGPKKELRIVLKYVDQDPVIEGVKRVSMPSRRVYVGATEIPRVLGGLGISILSTPNGVVTGKKAKRMKVGGELLCRVW